MTQRIARIYVSGDRKSLQSIWNSSHPGIPILGGAIVLETESSHYQELQSVYRRLSVEHQMIWHETQEVIYSESELSECEILTLWIGGSAGPGGNSYGQTYEAVGRCVRCAVEKPGKQVAPLRLDFQQIDNTDLSLTDDWEIVCSDGFRSVMRERKIPGVLFEPILPAADGINSDRQVHQLFITARLGPLSPSTLVVREGLCQLCGEYRNVGLDATESGEDRQLRFPRSSYRNEAIAQTQERFGDQRKFPLIVISEQFYQLLLKHQFSGWYVEPAHLEDP